MSEHSKRVFCSICGKIHDRIKGFCIRSGKNEQDKLMDRILTEALKLEYIPSERLNQSVIDKFEGIRD